MNCLHYSIPGKQSLRNYLARFPGAGDGRYALESQEHVSCHRVLKETVRRLSDPATSDGRRAEAVGAINAVFKELTADQRVRRNQSEYFSLRLLQAEAECSLKEFRADGDTSGFDRLRGKLVRELAPHGADTATPAVRLVDSSPLPSVSAAKVFAWSTAGRLMGFLLLLGLLVGGMVLAGIFTIGIGS